jgi:hypothetical protein
MAIDPILVRCFDSFARVRADAAGRLDDGAQPGPFDRLAWFEALHARAFPGDTPLIVHAQGGGGHAWLFLTGSSGGTLDGIANWYSFVFRPQFAGVEDRATRLALLGAIARELRGRSRHLRFYPIVDDDRVDADLIAQALHAGGWRVIPRVMARKRLIAIAPGTRFADYWAERPGTLRSTLKRKAQRHPAEIAIHHTVDDALWSAFETVFGASWKPDGDDFAFLRAFAEREAATGRLRLGIAHIDGIPAAVELWTVEQGRAYIHKLAFNERFAEVSPGTQLSYAMFAQAIDQDRVSLIDFGTGDNDYKAAWMPDAVPMRQIDAFDLRHPASWSAAFTTWLSALSQPSEQGGRLKGKTTGGRRAALEATERSRA